MQVITLYSIIYVFIAEKEILADVEAESRVHLVAGLDRRDRVVVHTPVPDPEFIQTVIGPDLPLAAPALIRGAAVRQY